MKGVTKEELIIIKNIIAPFKEKYKFFAYGSRVNGDFRELSDLDVMIKGEKAADISDIETLKEDFDNSNLSYIVNIVDFYSLSENFYDIIKKDLTNI